CFLNFHLLFLFHLLHLHLFSNHLLLHDIGLDVVSLVSLSLLFLRDLKVLSSLYLEIALRLGLLGERESFRQHSILVGLGVCHSRFSLRKGTFDGSVTICFSRRYVSVALDSRHIGTTHIRDVFVLVPDFLDGERDHFKTHLVHVIGTSGTHAVGNHLRLLYDLFDCQLADDSAEMTFHNQANQTFPLIRSLGQKLL